MQDLPSLISNSNLICNTNAFCSTACASSCKKIPKSKRRSSSSLWESAWFQQLSWDGACAGDSTLEQGWNLLLFVLSESELVPIPLHFHFSLLVKPCSSSAPGAHRLSQKEKYISQAKILRKMRYLMKSYPFSFPPNYFLSTIGMK